MVIIIDRLRLTSSNSLFTSIRCRSVFAAFTSVSHLRCYCHSTFPSSLFTVDSTGSRPRFVHPSASTSPICGLDLSSLPSITPVEAISGHARIAVSRLGTRVYQHSVHAHLCRCAAQQNGPGRYGDGFRYLVVGNESERSTIMFLWECDT